MANILIVGAMEEEVSEVQNWLKGTLKTLEKPRKLIYWEGSFKNHTLYLLQSGIGKVSSAVHLCCFLEHFKIDYLLNMGTAGGLQDNQSVGDLVFSSQVSYYDVDVTIFGYKIGQVPQMPDFYKPDENLLATAQKIALDLKIPFHTGLIISGDSFISQKSQLEFLQKHFREAICVEMEAAALAQTAYMYKIPFLILRSLSDKADSSSSVDFKSFVKKAAANSSQLVHKLVDYIQ